MEYKAYREKMKAELGKSLLGTKMLSLPRVEVTGCVLRQLLSIQSEQLTFHRLRS
jgi:hypothetical protein